MKDHRERTSYLLILAATLALFILLDILLTERFGLSSIVMLVGVVFALIAATAASGTRLALIRKDPSTRFRLGLVFYICLIAVAIGELNVLADRHPWEQDLTDDGLFTPEKATLHWACQIQWPLNITVFAREGSRIAELARALLGQLSRKNPQIHFDILDPDLVPAMAAKHRIRSPWYAIAQGRGRSLKFSVRTQEDYANAFRRIVEVRPVRICFVQGHSEYSIDDEGRGGLRKAAGLLRREHALVEQLNLVKSGEVPQGTDLVVVAAPRTDWTSSEIDALSVYLKNEAGRLLLLVEPAHLPLWMSFLEEEIGLRTPLAMVVDFDDHGKNDPSALIVRNWTQHPLTQDFDTVLMPGVSPLFTKGASISRSATILARSSKRSWADFSPQQLGYEEGVDIPGPISVATLIDVVGDEEFLSADGRKERRHSRVLVIGDADFATNAYIDTLGNREFWLSACSWLAREKSQIIYLPRIGGENRVYLSKRQFRAVFFVTVIGMPFLGGVLAFHAWWMKR